MMDVNLEAPFVRRDYERDWRFPEPMNRLNVSLEGIPDAMDEFAKYLELIAEEKNSVSVEIDELYSSEKSLLKILSLNKGDLSTIGKNPIQDFANNGSVEVFKYDDFYYTIIFPENCIDFKSILSAQCREFFILFWIRDQPRPIAHDCDMDRIEEYYLSRLGEIDLVVFLSPNHKHMEIMSLDEKFLVRLIGKICADD